jgi:hypothetical protein
VQWVDALSPDRLFLSVTRLARVRSCPPLTKRGHVHLVVSIPPSCSVADFVRHIKGSSSRHINRTFPKQHFGWQHEYGVFSLGGKQLEGAIAYVQQQKEHHASGSTRRGLEPEAIAQAIRG